MAPSPEWSVKRVRETFFSYFEENQHSQLSSSPVISVEDTHVPLIHTSSNQLKRTLDGPVPPDSKRRTCFSLRCIRATADKDVLDHYGRDSSYHSLTELLSSWSLDDYFKEEAIRLSWNLLTQKYNLSGDRIYVTYFGGDTTSDLSPDYDSRNIWMEYLPDRRILPSSCKASFWKAGDTGPCGPCVRIFFDGAKKKHGTTAVNINDERFVEISHLVFVQSNIQADGVVGSIQVKHAISSINVECITTILQKKKNIYETNVFAGILEVIRYGTGNEIPNYTGKVGPDDMDRVDWAYRLIADHLRMISAATAPHSQLGTKGREYFLTCADRLAVEFGHRVLNTKQERYDIVINTAIRSACLWPVEERIEEIILDEVKIYKKTLVEVLEAKRKNKSKQKQKPGNKNIASNVQSTSKPNVESSAIVWYRTRIVEFLDRRTPIILKDKHTHCSIVALCNALLLGGKIILGLGASRLSQDNLIHLIHKHLLYGNVHMQLQHNLELSDFQKEVLDVLPHLPGTLYFDLTFASIDGFVRTPTTTLFEFLGVPIYHSWLVDPQDADLYKAISTSSYLQHSLRVAVCISLCEISKSGVKKRGDLEEAGSLFKAMVSTMDGAEVHDSSNSTSGSLEMILVFLQGSQFTRHGFHSLLNNLKKNEPGLLLWNEHLITITKVDQQIYVLVNDLVVRTNVLWEEIVEVNLGGLFVDCNFTSADSKLTESMLPLTTNEIKMNQRMKKSMGLKVSAEGSQMNSGCTPAPFDLDAAPLPITLDTVYSVRPVDFFNLSTYVILQDSNGPCPIIALCNVLLLKRKITVEPDAGKVSMDYLVSLILPLLEGSKKMKVPPYSHMKMEILDLLPTLVKGLDVNILFNRTDGFSITPEYMLFDCLDVCLYHGWIINEEELDADVSAHSFEYLTRAVKDSKFSKRLDLPSQRCA